MEMETFTFKNHTDEKYTHTIFSSYSAKLRTIPFPSANNITSISQNSAHIDFLIVQNSNPLSSFQFPELQELWLIRETVICDDNDTSAAINIFSRPLKSKFVH